jgi:hypothetical protein
VCGDPRASINYVHFHEQTCVKYGVDLIGWPEGVKLVNPSQLTNCIATLTEICDGLKSKRIFFKKLTTKELEVAKEKHRQEVEAGTVIPYRRKGRSGKKAADTQKNQLHKSAEIVEDEHDDEDTERRSQFRPKKTIKSRKKPVPVVDNSSVEEPVDDGNSGGNSADAHEPAQLGSLSHAGSMDPDASLPSPVQPLSVPVSTATPEHQPLEDVPVPSNAPSSAAVPESEEPGNRPPSTPVPTSAPSRQPLGDIPVCSNAADIPESEAPAKTDKRKRKHHNSAGTPPPLSSKTRTRKQRKLDYLGYTAEEAASLL